MGLSIGQKLKKQRGRRSYKEVKGGVPLQIHSVCYRSSPCPGSWWVISSHSLFIAALLTLNGKG